MRLIELMGAVCPALDKSLLQRFSVAPHLHDRPRSMASVFDELYHPMSQNNDLPQYKNEEASIASRDSILLPKQCPGSWLQRLETWGAPCILKYC